MSQHRAISTGRFGVVRYEVARERSRCQSIPVGLLRNLPAGATLGALDLIADVSSSRGLAVNQFLSLSLELLRSEFVV